MALADSPERIPRILHYCWFGRRELPDHLKYCLRSWVQQCPQFTIRRWDEDTFDLGKHEFAESAYKLGKYAFVSDYVRAWALLAQGGVYLDTDVELRGPLDPYLTHRAFSGFETLGVPFTAVWGSEPDHPWPASVLESYVGRVYQPGEPPNTAHAGTLLLALFGIDPEEDRLQEGKDGVVIYPSTEFCLDLPRNVAVHHFSGSWNPDSSPGDYGQSVLAEWHSRQLVNLLGPMAVAEVYTQLAATQGRRKSHAGLFGLARRVIRAALRFLRRL